MKIKHTEPHGPLRRAQYPPLEDFADAMYWRTKGDNAPLIAYLEKVEAVKKQFPKSN